MITLKILVLAYMPGSFKGTDGKQVEWNQVLVKVGESQPFKVGCAVDLKKYEGKTVEASFEIRVNKEMVPRLKLTEIKA